MFKPNYGITPKITSNLMRLEVLKHEISGLPITPSVLASLRESARMSSIHYSTQIEGNQLTQQEVIRVIQEMKPIPGKERDEKEVLGYYVALEEVEKLAANQTSFSEEIIQTIHGLVMAGGKHSAKPTPYRDSQNVIRESRTGNIIYLPPEAKDVPELMHDLIDWIIQSEKDRLPYPLLASIAHYQFATIHPYYDGNGRTARLLTTGILHEGGYGLKGIYSLEEYYAKNLSAYYHAFDIGPSHNYYMGRAAADITPFIDYFCAGMLDSFERVHEQAVNAHKRGQTDASHLLRLLDARKRKVIAAYKDSIITSKEIEELFNLGPRTARTLCQRWTQENFLVIVDPSKKARRYALAEEYRT